MELTKEQIRDLLRLATGLEVGDPELTEVSHRVNVLMEGLSELEGPSMYSVWPTPLPPGGQDNERE